MKPNNSQTSVCALISYQAEFWSMAVDINDPIHENDLFKGIQLAVNYDNITVVEVVELKLRLLDMLRFVRSLNHEHE